MSDEHMSDRVSHDPRLTPFSGRVALESLRGSFRAERYTPGRPARIVVPVADLCLTPGGMRDRQVIFGAELLVIDALEDRVFVEAQADGYCGWLPASAVGPAALATHVVWNRATHVYRAASIKSGEAMRLSMGARLAALDEDETFIHIREGFVPRVHLRALDRPEADPVRVAERLLGTPYLWGGNSSDGIDCSGLVQMGLSMCGRKAPGDTDLQAAAFGAFLPEGEVPRRGDLLFWKGHVAMACDAEVLIHANGHTMSVAYEGIAACRARIGKAGDGPYLGMKRP